MAVPKKKVSRARRDRRRAHNFKVAVPTIGVCPNCKSPVLPHHACPTCGQYQGRQVINVEAETGTK